MLAVTLVAGCNKPAPPAELLRELVRKQRQDRIAIGRLDDVQLEFIVFGDQPEMRAVDLTKEQAGMLQEVQQSRPVANAGVSDAQRSPDGKWLTFRTRENMFVLVDAAGSVQRTLFAGDTTLSPPRWSPDSEYLMYIEKSWKWETTGCRVADGKDVMVYRVRDGQFGRVFQVCKGYPYTNLFWLHLPPSI